MITCFSQETAATAARSHASACPTRGRAIDRRCLPARAGVPDSQGGAQQAATAATEDGAASRRGHVLMAASLTVRGIVRLCSVSWHRGGYLTFWPNSDAKISALVPYSSPQKSSQKPTFLPLKTTLPLASFLTHVPFAALRSHFRTNQVLT